MAAVGLTRTFPAVQFRLMCCGVPALTAASRAGLSEFGVFSIEALKAAMLGVSLSVPGKYTGESNETHTPLTHSFTLCN